MSGVRKEIAVKNFAGKIAVITGGGSGMGRELALQLGAMGCDIAICDVFAESMAETKRLYLFQAPAGEFSLTPARVTYGLPQPPVGPRQSAKG